MHHSPAVDDFKLFTVTCRAKMHETYSTFQAHLLGFMQDSRQADPRKRMRRFFESLYASLARGGRAVLQMYPENTDQVIEDYSDNSDGMSR